MLIFILYLSRFNILSHYIYNNGLKIMYLETNFADGRYPITLCFTREIIVLTLAFFNDKEELIKTHNFY